MEKNRSSILPPEAWDLTHEDGELRMGGHSLTELANEFGTPLHVVNESGLLQTARAFAQAIHKQFGAHTEIHYPFKCNPVPAVVSIIRSAGYKAEVMTPYEYETAKQVGFAPNEIIVNGPYKSEAFLRQCLTDHVRLVIVDSISELGTLGRLACELDDRIEILLRVRATYAARGANWFSATGGKGRSSFGLDMEMGEVESALRMIADQPRIHFRGFHMHIGTGIRDVRTFEIALQSIARMKSLAAQAGQTIEVLDVGGGLASVTSREFTSLELLLYQSMGRLPASKCKPDAGLFNAYAQAVGRAIRAQFALEDQPLILFEPGRAIASRNQLLLLRVVGTKKRSKRESWIICDGGISTVSMPTYYEYHEVFPCEGPMRPRTECVTLLGPACFTGDLIYRNKLMPDLKPGDVIAVMDSGAYFTQLESNFGYPRPAIIGVGPDAIAHDGVHLLRERETIEQMAARDLVHNDFSKQFHLINQG